MKCQDLFSKKKKKYIYLKVSSAAVLIGALRVKVCFYLVGISLQVFPAILKNLSTQCGN